MIIVLDEGKKLDRANPDQKFILLNSFINWCRSGYKFPLLSIN